MFQSQKVRHMYRYCTLELMVSVKSLCLHPTFSIQCRWNGRQHQCISLEDWDVESCSTDFIEPIAMNISFDNLIVFLRGIHNRKFVRLFKRNFCNELMKNKLKNKLSLSSWRFHVFFSDAGILACYYSGEYLLAHWCNFVTDVVVTVTNLYNSEKATCVWFE